MKLFGIPWALFLMLVSFLIEGTCFGADVQLTASSQKAGAGAKTVTVEEFDRLRNDHKAVTLDVRTPAEYAQGHIPGAINIDCASRDFSEKIAALDRNHQYLVHCAAGTRSPRACERMAKLNFTNLYALNGGFKAWEQAGKPIEKVRLASDKTRAPAE